MWAVHSEIVKVYWKNSRREEKEKTIEYQLNQIVGCVRWNLFANLVINDWRRYFFYINTHIYKHTHIWIMLMPGATDTEAALAANVIVRASYDSVIPGKMKWMSIVI